MHHYAEPEQKSNDLFHHPVVGTMHTTQFSDNEQHKQIRHHDRLPPSSVRVSLYAERPNKTKKYGVYCVQRQSMIQKLYPGSVFTSPHTCGCQTHAVRISGLKFIVHGPGIETLPMGIFGDNDFWIAQYVSFQYLLFCKMNYSAFRDYLIWYIAA